MSSSKLVTMHLYQKEHRMNAEPAVREFKSHFHLFLGGSGSKESACNAGELDSIPWLGGSLGEGNGNPLHYSCLENSMNQGAWQATVDGVAKS